MTTKQPLFSRRHYEFLAQVAADYCGFDEFMIMLAQHLKRDNPAFDVERFKKACR